jgi:histidinol-phosphate aminotransferase
MKISKYLKKFDQSGTKVYIPHERYSIDLSLTENPLGFSPKVIEAIDKHKTQINHYSDPYHRELRDCLSNKFDIPSDQIIFGAGTDGLIENIVRILVSPGDEVVMPELTFLNTSFVASIVGGRTVFSKMKNNFRIDFEELNNKVNKNTKVIFVCNPNNPTGLVERRSDLLSLVESTESLVVVDEANVEFAGESLIRDAVKHDNLMVLRTFSKGYGLAGMRIGYCVGNKKLLHYIWRIRPPFVNTYLAEKAVLAALEDDDHISNSKEYLREGRLYLSSELKRLGFEVFESEANCFLVKIPRTFESSTQFNELLHQRDCTVVDGKHFRGLGSRYVRIAPQLHEANKKFIEIVEKLVSHGNEL